MKEKRMAGDYEIFQSFSAGAVEIVLGENLSAPPGERFMCARCSTNALFTQYSGVQTSDNYAEIAEIYTHRIQAETEKLRDELAKPEREGIRDAPVFEDGCTPVTPDDNLNNRVVLIRADVLKPEYRRATRQYQLCSGGFGASPHSRGTACYCVNLYDGQENRFERYDILGTVSEDQMPGWVKEGLQRIAQQRGSQRDAR